MTARTPEQDEIEELYLQWVTHPYSRLLKQQTEDRISKALDMLRRVAEDSTDPKVVRAVCAYNNLNETLKSLRGDEK